MGRISCFAFRAGHGFDVVWYLKLDHRSNIEVVVGALMSVSALSRRLKDWIALLGKMQVREIND